MIYRSPSPKKSSGAICPTLGRSGDAAYNVQFLHQTVKTFSASFQRSYVWPSLYPMNGNGYAYVVRYILALAFHHPQSDSIISERRNADGTKDESTENKHFWLKDGAYQALLTLDPYLHHAEAKVPRVLFSTFVEFGDNRIRDLFDNKVWLRKTQFNRPTTVIAFAALFELCDILDALLEQSPKNPQVRSQPLLHFAINGNRRGKMRNGRNCSRMLHALLDHGADASVICEGHTAYDRLCELAIVGHLPFFGEEFLDLLLPFLEAGQDPNVQVEYGTDLSKKNSSNSRQSILHHAAYLAHVDMVKVLIQYGADIKDESGLTPLDWLCNSPKVFDNYPLAHHVQLFLDRDLSALEMRHFWDLLEVAALLVSKGAKYGAPDTDLDHKVSIGLRRGLTQADIDGLRSRGICELPTLQRLGDTDAFCTDIDDRLVREPRNQLESREPGLIAQSLNFMKRQAG